MAEANGIVQEVLDLRVQQELLEHILLFLYTELVNHVREQGEDNLIRYHATVRVITRGRNRGTPTVQWHCVYCHAIYRHARLCNRHHNDLYSRIRQTDPIRHGLLEDRMELIHFLEPPFPPIEDMERVLRELAQNEPSPEPEEEEAPPPNQAQQRANGRPQLNYP